MSFPSPRREGSCRYFRFLSPTRRRESLLLPLPPRVGQQANEAGRRRGAWGRLGRGHRLGQDQGRHADHVGRAGCRCRWPWLGGTPESRPRRYQACRTRWQRRQPHRCCRCRSMPCTRCWENGCEMRVELRSFDCVMGCVSHWHPSWWPDTGRTWAWFNGRLQSVGPACRAGLGDESPVRQTGPTKCYPPIPISEPCPNVCDFRGAKGIGGMRGSRNARQQCDGYRFAGPSFEKAIIVRQVLFSVGAGGFELTEMACSKRPAEGEYRFASAVVTLARRLPAAHSTDLVCQGVSRVHR